MDVVVSQQVVGLVALFFNLFFKKSLFYMCLFWPSNLPVSHHLLCICLCEEEKKHCNLLCNLSHVCFPPCWNDSMTFLSTTVLVAFLIGSCFCLSTVNVLFLATQSVQFTAAFATPCPGCDRCLHPGSIANRRLVQPPTSKRRPLLLGVCGTHKG